MCQENRKKLQVFRKSPWLGRVSRGPSPAPAVSLRFRGPLSEVVREFYPTGNSKNVPWLSRVSTYLCRGRFLPCFVCTSGNRRRRLARNQALKKSETNASI